jgi:hypothetical protein
MKVITRPDRQRGVIRAFLFDDDLPPQRTLISTLSLRFAEANPGVFEAWKEFLQDALCLASQAADPDDDDEGGGYVVPLKPHELN